MLHDGSEGAVVVQENSQPSLPAPPADGLRVFQGRGELVARHLPGSRHGNLPEMASDAVGPLLPQGLRLSGAVDPEDAAEAPQPSRLDSGQGVLHHHGPPRIDLQAPGRLEEDIRCGFSRKAETVGFISIHHGIEEPLHSRGRQDLPAVAARRDDGRRKAPFSESTNQVDGAGVELHPLLLQVLPEEAVLQVSEPADRLPARLVAGLSEGELDAAGGEKALHPLVPRLAVHVAKIIAFDIEGLEALPLPL